MQISALPGIPAPFKKKAADDNIVTFTPSTVDYSQYPWLGAALGTTAGLGAGGKLSYNILKSLAERMSPAVAGVPDVPGILSSLTSLTPPGKPIPGTPAVPGVPSLLKQKGVRRALASQLGGVTSRMGVKDIAEHLGRIPHSALQSEEGRKAIDWLARELRMKPGAYGAVPNKATIKRLLKNLSGVLTPGRPGARAIPAAVRSGLSPEILRALGQRLTEFKVKVPELYSRFLGAGAAAPAYEELLKHLQAAPILGGKPAAAATEFAAREAAKQFAGQRRGLFRAFKEIPGRGAIPRFTRTGGWKKAIPTGVGRKSLLYLIPALLGGLGYYLGTR
jgi:hypothetical protein